MTRGLGIGGHFAAVVIATGALLWCDGSLAAETRAILLRGYLGLFSDGLGVFICRRAYSHAALRCEAAVRGGADMGNAPRNRRVTIPLSAVGRPIVLRREISTRSPRRPAAESTAAPSGQAPWRS